MLKREELNDDAVVALLYEHAAERAGKLAVERVDGHWRAGFVVPNDLGESVIELPTEGPDPSAARRELLIRAAEAAQTSARLAIRTAAALEKSADVADQHAARHELAGRSDAAARERRTADRARHASLRARSHAQSPERSFE
jgi:hypothetical protein